MLTVAIIISAKLAERSYDPFQFVCFSRIMQKTAQSIFIKFSQKGGTCAMEKTTRTPDFGGNCGSRYISG